MTKAELAEGKRDEHKEQHINRLYRSGMHAAPNLRELPPASALFEQSLVLGNMA